MTRGGEATPGLSGPLALLPLGHSAQISVPHTKPVFAGLGEQGMRRPAQGSPVSEAASRDPGHTCCLEQPGVGKARPSGSGSLCAGEPTLAHLSHTSASTVVGGPVPVLLLHLCPHSASSPCSRGQAVRVSAQGGPGMLTEVLGHGLAGCQGRRTHPYPHPSEALGSHPTLGTTAEALSSPTHQDFCSPTVWMGSLSGKG